METPDFEHGIVYFKQFGAVRVQWVEARFELTTSVQRALVITEMGIACRPIKYEYPG